MDASCKIQRSIHVFNITNKSMCPDFWVHIRHTGVYYFDAYADDGFLLLLASFFYRNFDNKSQNIVKCVLTMEKFNNFM